MTPLLKARIDFTRCLGKLLNFAASRDVVLSEGLRDPRTAAWNASHCRVAIGSKRCERPVEDHPAIGHQFKPIGILKSVHSLGLAVDLYVIDESEKISNNRAIYQPLGEYWKTLDTLARWGGDFEGFPDLGHFSFTWEGRS